MAEKRDEQFNSQPEQLESIGGILKRIEFEGGEVLVRYAQKEDLQGILEVSQAIAKEDTIDERKAVEKLGDSWWLEHLTPNEEDPNIAIVAEIDGKICGDILVGKTMKEHSHYAPYWVLTIGVDPIKDPDSNPKYRHKGLGKALLETAISETKNTLKAESIGLSVWAENVEAVKLYESEGFKPVKVFEGGKWRGKPSDNIYMVKQLQESSH